MYVVSRRKWGRGVCRYCPSRAVACIASSIQNHSSSLSVLRSSLSDFAMGSHQAELEGICNLIGDAEYNKLVRAAASKGIDVWEYIGHRDSQQQVMPDVSNGAYNNNIVRLDSLSAQQQWWSIADSKLQIPFTLVSSCPTSVTAAAPTGITKADYGPTTQIGFGPVGALGTISGIKVSLASGQVLVNEQGVNWYHAAMRFITEHDWDWLQGEGLEIGAALPAGVSSSYIPPATSASFYGGATNGAATTTLGPFYTPTVATASNTVYNPAAIALSNVTSLSGGVDTGFLKRVQALQTMSAAYGPSSAKTIQGMVELPMYLIHDLLRKMNLPLIGVRYLIDLTIATQIRGTVSQATNFTTSTTAATVVDQFAAFTVAPGTPPPLLFIGNQTMSSVQWAYNKLELSPAVSSIVNTHLNSKTGLLKEFTFDAADAMPTFANNQPGATLNQPISSGAQRVKGFAAFLFPTITAALSAAGLSNYNVSRPVLTDNSWGISSSNLLVNSQNLYSTPFVTPARYWDEISKLFPIDADGKPRCMINLRDYLDGVCGILYYDVSHVSSNLMNRNAPITLNWTNNRTSSTTTLDFQPIVITERSVTLSVGNSTFAITVGVPV